MLCRIRPYILSHFSINSGKGIDCRSVNPFYGWKTNVQLFEMAYILSGRHVFCWPLLFHKIFFAQKTEKLFLTLRCNISSSQILLVCSN